MHGLIRPVALKSNILLKFHGCDFHLDLTGPIEIMTKNIDATKLATNKSSEGVKNCNDNLNAVATVDQQNTATRARNMANVMLYSIGYRVLQK